MKPRKAPKNSQIDKAIALLISSTKRKNRAVPLTDIADAASIARRHFGSISNVARTIGLTGKMLGQFCRINELEPEVRQLIATREIDSVDAVVHLAQLRRREQLIASKALANKEIDTKDLRAIVELHKLDSGAPFLEVIERVKSSRTQRQYVAEFIVRGGLDESQLRRRFQKYLGSENILKVSVSGSFGRIVLNLKGYIELKNTAQRLGVSLKQVPSVITMQGT